MSDTGPQGGAENFDPAIFLTGDEEANNSAITDAFKQQFEQEENKEDKEGNEGEVETPEANSPQTTDSEPEEDGGEGGGEGDASGATGGETDFATLLTQKFGRNLSVEEIDGLVSLSQWAANLKPEQSEAINRYILQGELPPSPTPQTPPEPTEYEKLAEDFKDDPQLGPLYAGYVRMEQELNAIRGTVVQQSQQQSIEQATVSIDTASKQFKDSNGLSDTDIEALHSAIANSRILPGFVNANNGDVAKGMEQALHYAFWTSPTFREAAIAKQIEDQKNKETQHQQRKIKASAVSGGSGGNGASRVASPPKSNDDRWAAVLDGVKSAVNNGQG